MMQLLYLLFFSITVTPLLCMTSHSESGYLVIRDEPSKVLFLINTQNNTIELTSEQNFGQQTKTVNMHFVKSCITKKARLANGNSMLHLAITGQNTEHMRGTLNIMYRNNIDPNGDSALYDLITACDRNPPNFNFFSTMVDANWSWSIYGFQDLLRHVISSKWLYGNINYNNQTPKSLALPHPATAQILTSYEQATGTHIHCLPPLHYACEIGSLPAVWLLLQAGVNVNARNHLNETPLHIACRNNNVDMALLLLSRGANPTLEDCFKVSCTYIMQTTIELEKVLQWFKITENIIEQDFNQLGQNT